MHSTKSSTAPRRVWRMTADNQLGEILELPVEPGPGRKRESRRARHAPASEQLAAKTAFEASLASASTPTEDSRSPVARTPGSAGASGWRASSYDLLHGLVVRDVSEAIPRRIFDELFRADAAGVPQTSGKRR